MRSTSWRSSVTAAARVAVPPIRTTAAPQYAALFPGAPRARGNRQGSEVLETLKDSQWVRLASPGFGRQEGRLLERSASELVLSPEPQPIRVPATSIDTMGTRGTSVKTGAIAGALIGAALGVGLGLTWCDEGSDCGAPEAAPAFGAVGLGGGSAWGALWPKWRRRYP